MYFLLIALLAQAATGVLHGRITYFGRAPAPRKLIITKDPAVCGATRMEEKFDIGPEGGVKEVVVYLTEGPSTEPAKARVVDLDQKGCRYIPHVQIAPLGSVLKVRTSDPIAHNVHSFLNGSTVINFAMPPIKTMVLAKTLDKPGGQQLKCDIHNFMTGGIFVSETRLATITGDDGEFEIRDIPPGNWMMNTWHQAAGAISQRVPIRAGVTTEFSAKIR